MEFIDTKETETKQRLRHIREHPEVHAHLDMNELQRCCTVISHTGEPAIDLSLIDAHAEANPIGYNGGAKCDVFDGPCACGAWHSIKDWRGLTPFGQVMRKRVLEKMGKKGKSILEKEAKKLAKKEKRKQLEKR